MLGADVDLGYVVVGALGAALMTWINYIGIRTAAFIQTMVTGLILLAGFTLFTGAGLSGEFTKAEPLITSTGGIMVQPL